MSEREPDLREQGDIELRFPITVDGQIISTITMRRPKVRDNLKAQRAKGGEMEKGLALMSDLCGLAPEQLQDIDEIDLEKLQDQYLAFTGRSATSGS